MAKIDNVQNVSISTSRGITSVGNIENVVTDNSQFTEERRPSSRIDSHDRVATDKAEERERQGSNDSMPRSKESRVSVDLNDAPLYNHQYTGGEPGRSVDLQILVSEEQQNGQTVLSYELRAADPSLGLNFASYGPVFLRCDPFRYFTDLICKIEGLASPDATKRVVAEKQLDAIGAQLGDQLLPTELTRVLWSLRERVKTIQILSDEPWIPWELLRLRSPEDGILAPFLGESFAITRWLRGVPECFSLPMNRVALVAPEVPELRNAVGECEFIMSLGSERRTVSRIEARYIRVVEALASGGYDGWHFIGHGISKGNNPSQWALQLEAFEELSQRDLHGEARRLGGARPLVFLNGCRTGRGAQSLTGIGGWAQEFLVAGAGAFVGSHWAVPDSEARAFAEAFYRFFISGMPGGEAARRARCEIRESFPGSPTWLAYTVFAHPLASCS